MKQHVNEFSVSIKKPVKKTAVIRLADAGDAADYAFEDFGTRHSPLSTDQRTNEAEQEPAEEVFPRYEVEALVNDAYSRGFEDGREVTEGLVGKEIEQYKEYIRSIDHVAENLEKELQKTLTGIEQAAIEMGILIAEKILHHELRNDHEGIILRVKSALAAVSHAESVAIHCNPHDFEALKKAESTLIAGTDEVRSLNVVPDISVEVGGAIVTTPMGSVDMRISSLMQDVIRALDGA